MPQVMTAEDVFFQVKQMSTKERLKFFTLIAMNAFQESEFNHEQVFGHLKHESFNAEEAAQYLEVSMPTFRRYVQSGKLKPSKVVGRSQLFATSDLRRFKQKIS